MRKFNALLHDVTVINFKVVGKIFVRFYKIPAVLFILASIIVPYLYFSQEMIYQKEIYFKVLAPLTDNTKNNLISDLVESSSSFLKKPEILALISDYDFTTAFVNEVTSNPKFNELDFRSPLATVRGTVVNESQVLKQFNSCSEITCKKKYLREMLPSLFILDSEFGTSRFKLVVSTYSSEATLVIVRAFKFALEKTRQQEVSESIDKQILQTQDLIARSHSEIELKGGFEKVASKDFLNALVEQQSSTVKDLAVRLNTEKSHLNFQQIRLKESGITANSQIEDTDKLHYEKYSKISKRVDELRHNIAAINSIPLDSRTASDDEILKQLRVELSNGEKALSDLGNLKRNIARDDSFISTQVDNQVSFEFDYKVSTEKLKKLQSDYDNAKKNLDALFMKRSSMTNALLTLQPDLEYLKQLEGKLVSMKMKKSALNSDVKFDEFGNDIFGFTKNSFTRLTVFSFALILFLSFLIVITVYLFDDRIYDREELLKCSDLPVIGEVPHFD